MTIALDRIALVAALVKAMDDTNDQDVRRVHFAAAGLRVLEKQGVSLPTGDDLSDLTDEIADAMWDKETGPDWNTPTWHPYADVVLAIAESHNLIKV